MYLLTSTQRYGKHKSLRASELSTGRCAICCLKNEFAYSVFFNHHGTSRTSFWPKVSCTNTDLAEQLFNCGHSSLGLPLLPLLLFWLGRNEINPFPVCVHVCVHKSARAPAHLYARMCVCACTSVCTSAHVGTCISVQMCAHVGRAQRLMSGTFFRFLLIY